MPVLLPGIKVVSLSGSPIEGIYHHISGGEIYKVHRELGKLNSWGAAAKSRGLSGGLLLEITAAGAGKVRIIQVPTGPFVWKIGERAWHFITLVT
jgi:hypothetical protein